MKKKKFQFLFVPLCWLFLSFAVLLWGWFLRPKPFLDPLRPQTPALLEYDRKKFIQALSGDRAAQKDFLFWRIKKGAQVAFPEERLSSQEFSQKRPLPTVFAQSFAAASLALALCEKQQILAIPSQLKLQKAWHNPDLLSSVAYTSEEVDSELLYRLEPKRCLASHFSNPSSLARFQRLNLPTLLLPRPDTIESLEESIEQTSGFVEQKERGTWLLETFRQSLLWLKSELPKALCTRPFLLPNNRKESNRPRLLLLERYREMSLPSYKQLYMQWLFPLSDRFPAEHPSPGESLPGESLWSTPIDYECLYSLRPALVLLLSDSIEETEKNLLQDPSWQRFVRQNPLKYSLVSAQCLRSPSQIFAIGLYDLVSALQALYSETKNEGLE